MRGLEQIGGQAGGQEPVQAVIDFSARAANPTTAGPLSESLPHRPRADSGGWNTPASPPGEEVRRGGEHPESSHRWLADIINAGVRRRDSGVGYRCNLRGTCGGPPGLLIATMSMVALTVAVLQTGVVPVLGVMARQLHASPSTSAGR